MNKLEKINIIHSNALSAFSRVYRTSKSELTEDNKHVISCFRSEESFDNVETVSFGYKHGSCKTNNMLITHFGLGGKAVGNLTSYFQNNNITLNYESSKITKDGITVNDSDIYECRNDELRSLNVDINCTKDEYFNHSLEYNLCKFELFEYSKSLRMYIPCVASLFINDLILGTDLL